MGKRKGAYQFEKRQKELKRQKKKEEKLQKKLAKKNGDFEYDEYGNPIEDDDDEFEDEELEEDADNAENPA